MGVSPKSPVQFADSKVDRYLFSYSKRSEGILSILSKRARRDKVCSWSEVAAWISLVSGSLEKTAAKTRQVGGEIRPETDSGE